MDTGDSTTPNPPHSSAGSVEIPVRRTRHWYGEYARPSLQSTGERNSCTAEAQISTPDPSGAEGEAAFQRSGQGFALFSDPGTADIRQHDAEGKRFEALYLCTRIVRRYYRRAIPPDVRKRRLTRIPAVQADPSPYAQESDAVVSL